MKSSYLIIPIFLFVLLEPHYSLGSRFYNTIDNKKTYYDLKQKSDTSNYKYKTFYDFLVRERYPFSMLGTLTQFTKKLKMKSHAKLLYEGLRKDGYSELILGTEQQFIKKYCTN